MFADDEAVDYSDDDVQQIQHHERQLAPEQPNGTTPLQGSENASNQQVAPTAAAPGSYADGKQAAHADADIIEASDPTLPSGWKAIMSRSAGGDTYYYNSTTGESTWDKPTRPADDAAQALEAPLAAAALASAALSATYADDEAHAQQSYRDVRAKADGPTAAANGSSAEQQQQQIHHQHRTSITSQEQLAIDGWEVTDDTVAGTSASSTYNGSKRDHRDEPRRNGEHREEAQGSAHPNPKRRRDARNARREEAAPQGISIRGSAASAASANAAHDGVGAAASLHDANGEDDHPSRIPTGPKSMLSTAEHDMWPPRGKRRRRESEECGLQPRDAGWAARSAAGRSSLVEPAESAGAAPATTPQTTENPIAAAYASRNKIRGSGAAASPDAPLPSPTLWPVADRSERGGGRWRGAAKYARPPRVSPDCYRPSEEAASAAVPPPPPHRAASIAAAEPRRRSSSEKAASAHAAAEPVSLLTRLSSNGVTDDAQAPRAAAAVREADAEAARTQPDLDSTNGATHSDRLRERPSGPATPGGRPPVAPPSQADTPPVANRWGRNARPRDMSEHVQARPETTPTAASPPAAVANTVALDAPSQEAAAASGAVPGWAAMRARRGGAPASQPSTPAVTGRGSRRDDSVPPYSSGGGRGGGARRCSRSPPAPRPAAASGWRSRVDASPAVPVASPLTNVGRIAPPRPRGARKVAAHAAAAKANAVPAAAIPMRQWGKPEQQKKEVEERPAVVAGQEKELSLAEREERIRRRERELGLI